MNQATEIASAEMTGHGPGAILARERAGKGMSVAEIAAQLRYSPKQIEALEGDDYSRLPGTTFVRGMIRGYAKVLGTPAAPILQALEQRHIPSPITVDLRSKRVPFPDGRARSTRVYVWLSAVVALLVAAVLYEWHFGLPQSLAEAVRPSATEAPKAQVVKPMPQPVVTEMPPEAVPAPKPGPLPPIAANAGPVHSASGGMRFEFEKDAWVEVRERNGRILIAQNNPAGTQTIVDGTPPFALVIGNAANVRLTYGDKAVDLKQHTKVNVARFTLD